MDNFSIDGFINEQFTLFHGTGGNEYSLLQIAGDINPNADILSFIGEVGEGTERRFFEPLQNGLLQREDFEQRVVSFLKDWEKLKPQHKKTTMIGYSNGANFILGLLEKEPNLADRIVLMHPSNLHYSFEQGSAIEIFITAGALDGLAIPGETVKLAKQLEMQFPKTTMKLFDGAHQVTDAEIDYLQGKLV